MKLLELAPGVLPCALAGALASGALACGGTNADAQDAGGNDAAPVSPDASSGGSTDASSSSDAATTGDGSVRDAGLDAGVSYYGFVTAVVFSPGASELETGFWAAGGTPPPGTPDPDGACGTAGLVSGSCCEHQIRLGLPVGDVAPVAGNVTIADHGATVATLVSPDYAEVADAVWNPGDALSVSAAGGDVAAFSGTLLTPIVIAGLTLAGSSPASQTPVAIPHGTALRVSWTPEAKADEFMEVDIDAIRSGMAYAVLCAVPDSDGSLVIDSSLLEPLVGASSASFDLVRSITSSVTGPNATITLEGDISLKQAVTIE